MWNSQGSAAKKIMEEARRAREMEERQRRFAQQCQQAAEEERLNQELRNKDQKIQALQARLFALNLVYAQAVANFKQLKEECEAGAVLGEKKKLPMQSIRTLLLWCDSEFISIQTALQALTREFNAADPAAASFASMMSMFAQMPMPGAGGPQQAQNHNLDTTDLGSVMAMFGRMPMPGAGGPQQARDHNAAGLRASINH